MMKHLHDKRVERVLISEVPTAMATDTIEMARLSLEKNIGSWKTIDYIYVVDKKHRLTGVLSVKEIFRSRPETLIKKVASASLITIDPHASQEAAAALALSHHLKAIPVVGLEKHFLGVVPHDTLLQILQQEAREDVLHIAGIHHKGAAYDDVLTMSIVHTLRHRIPWLILGLIGGIVAAHIIDGFEETLSGNIVLAAFIPLIVYMADAVGTQLQAFVIRDFAADAKVDYKKYFLKQSQIVLATSAIVGVLLAIFSVIRFQDTRLAIVLSISLACASVSSVITGLFIPYLFTKAKSDPANASGPIGTIIQDILSIVIYFGVATWLL